MLLRDIERLEAAMMQEVVRRRQLGGYSADADAILLIAETVLRMLQHMRDFAMIREAENTAKVDGQPKG